MGDIGWQGGIQYVTSLVYAIDKVSEGREIEIHLLRHDHQPLIEFRKLQHVTVHDVIIKDVLPPLNYTGRAKWWMIRKLTNGMMPRFENYFIENKFDFVFPMLLSDHHNKLNSASWIADFHYHHFPDGASKEVIANAKRVISDIAYRGKKIVLSSRFCEKDSFEIFPVTKGKTHVMSFAVYIDPGVFDKTNFAEVRDRYSLPERYLMVSNMFTPSKNHKTVFNAMGLLKKQGVEVNLVCTGNVVDYRNEGFTNEIIQCITKNKIRGQVHLLGLIPREDQMSVFRMSTAIVQPSVNEGWNTSVEEAKALGKDIIMSDIDVHREQYPGNPYFFSGLDAEDLADKIMSIWLNHKPGSVPDIETERKAFEQYQANLVEFGNKFLEIAAFEN